MKRVTLLKVIILTLTLSDIFYVLSFQLSITSSFDNVFIGFSVVLIISLSISYLENVKDLKVKKENLIYAVLIGYSLFVAFNFSNDFIRGDVVTYFSHRSALPALFAPLAITFGRRIPDIKELNKTLLFCLFLSTVFYLVYVAIFGPDGIQHFTTHMGLLIPLTILIKQRTGTRIVLFLILLSFITIHFVYDNRTLLLIAFIVLLTGFFDKIVESRTAKLTAVIAGIALVYSFSEDIMNYYKYYIVSNYRNETSMIGELLTSRTFVYLDFFEDLTLEDLVTGRGILGYSFSEYFLKYAGDHYERFTVEPGILNVILKGGLILLFIYLSIFIKAIHSNSIFKFGKIDLTLVMLVVSQLFFSIFNLGVLAFTFWYIIGYKFRDQEFLKSRLN